MKSIHRLSERYERQRKRIGCELAVGLTATLCIAALIISVGLNNVKVQAKHYADDIRIDYSDLVGSYVRIFDTVYDRIVEKIQEDPTFDELDAWLKSKDAAFAQSMGSRIYDGIALTYKGGYAHSWSYGDYTDYDATTRPWYRAAQEANGATAVVPPYVTFLDAQYLNDDSYILMSVVKKYNDEISFDYDIKLGEIETMLQNQKSAYPGAEVLMFDGDGYILSCSDAEKFAHNIYTPDDMITVSLSSVLTSAANAGRLTLQVADGTAAFFFLEMAADGNTICVRIPFWDVVEREFLAVMIALLALVAFEIYLYRKSKQRLYEFSSRDEQLSAITNAAFLGCLYVDPATMLFSGSAPAERLFPTRSYEELFQYLLDKVEDPGERVRMQQYVSPQALRENAEDLNRLEAWRVGMNWKQADGTAKQVTMEISRVFSLLNGVQMACLLIRDISEDAAIMKEALAQAKSASTAKTEFLTRVSHDMRTPLNVIIGMNHLAQENDNPKDTDVCLKKIDISSEFLLGLINDVLDLERIESGKIQLSLAPYTADEFAQYISSVIRPLCEQKSVDFHYTIDAPDNFTILQDKLRINQIYFNILSNAVKFTPEGGQIDFHTVASRKGDKILLDVSVTDTGIGMGEAFQAHMFESFTQENRGIPAYSAGSGLGLAIVKRLCDLMGMTISVKSELGHGTTFYIHGEYDTAPAAPNQGKAAVPASKRDHLAGKTVLVCEDHPLNQEITRRLLEKKGVVCLLAEDGRRGVDCFKASALNDISAVLMDIRMPVMDGLEAARQIRALERADAKTVPIIALSANAYDEDVHKCLDAGMNAHLSKPINPERLYKALEEFMHTEG